MGGGAAGPGPATRARAAGGQRAERGAVRPPSGPDFPGLLGRRGEAGRGGGGAS